MTWNASAARGAAPWLSLLALSCARDVSLPPPPGPGTIQGRVVYAVAGQSERAAAQGARVSVLSTSLAAIADAQGRFVLEGVTQTDGLLLVQVDLSSPPDGVPDKQTLIELSAIKAGPGRDAVLGDVVVVENAKVRGRALRSNVTTPGGHAGTLVFVPQGPFVTQTSDDGSYLLPNLPEGRVTLTFFRDGYDADAIDGIQLSAGEDLTARDVSLKPASGPGAAAPGAIRGTVSFTPATSSATQATVSAFPIAGVQIDASPDAAGAFSMPSVPAGLYRVEVSLAGYTTAVVSNVLVAPGGEAQLSVNLVQNAPPPPPPPPPPAPVTCVENIACTLPNPCQIGATNCATGTPVCASVGNALDGIPCGTNQVCQGGACTFVCSAGVSCQPANPCHAGAVACSGGAATCADSGSELPDGTVCGVNQVCRTGICVACAAGTSCAVPGQPCLAGVVSCSTGSPLCVGSAALADGTSCGADFYCHAGACGACAPGALCTPANPCHAGATSCVTGLPVCADTAVQIADGASCGTNQVCRAGSCGPCVVGAACDGAAGHAPAPSPPDPCKTYATACATGLPLCGISGNQPEGTGCGGTNVCVAGICGPASNRLLVTTPPAALHALPNQTLPVTLQLVDQNGTPIAASASVTLTAPSGAAPSDTAAAPSVAATTAADGTVAFAPRLGRGVGPQRFTATSAGVLDLDLVLTADAPAGGTLLPLANVAHAYAYSIAAGPASNLPLTGTHGIGVAADGTVYFTEQYGCVVKRIRPDGSLDVVAGTGSCGFNGEQGPASGVELYYPLNVTLDEARGRLYLADTYNARVRMIDLLDARGPWLQTIAGDGTPGAPPYGDGGPATSAQLYYPTHVAVGPETPPAIYIADGYHNSIRRVDGVTNAISTLVAPLASCSGGGLGLYTLSTYYGSGSMAFDEKGQLFFSGWFCGPETGGYSIAGVARRAADGTLTLVAGAQTGLVGNGIPARSVSFTEPPAIAFDRAALPAPPGALRSNLFLAAPGGNYLARVDGASGRFDVVAGTCAAGSCQAGRSGDFGPATAATLTSPWAIAFRPGTRDLYVAEGNTYGVALVAGAGSAAASDASLTSLAAPIARFPDQSTGDAPVVPLQVKLLDGAAAPLAGFAVSFGLDPAGLPGGWLGTSAATTAADGVAGVLARPGLALGRYGVVASFRDLHGDHVAGSPAVVDVNAVAPPAGTVFSVANQTHATSLSGVPGPGAVAGFYQPFGLALAADGSAYFTESYYWRIFKTLPSGLLELFAGNGTGAPADGAPATASGFYYPAGLALDEAGGALYVGDQYNDRVRRIDLAPPNIVTTLAGGGASNADGPAADTTLLYPTRLALVGGKLYVSDRTGSADRLRRIDLGASPPAIETFLDVRSTSALPAPAQVPSCLGTNPTTFWGCGSDPGCSVAPGPGGRLYVSGTFCGAGTHNPPASGTVYGIARVDLATGALTYVAGVASYPVLPDLTQASLLSLDAPVSLATDAAGNLWVAKRGSGAAEQKVGWFAADAGGLVGPTSLFHLVGKPSAAGEYLDQSLAGFTAPSDVAVGAHAWVADGGTGEHSVRVVW